MMKSSEKSNAVPEKKPGRWTPEEAREQGRRGGIARWAKDEDVDERAPAAASA